MTDAELLAASIPAACDLLEERGLAGAAHLVRTALSKADLLERAVSILEDEVRTDYFDDIPASYILPYWRGRIDLIAVHRNETIEATLARLAPPPSPRFTHDRPVVDPEALQAWFPPHGSGPATLGDLARMLPGVAVVPPEGRPLVDVLADEPEPDAGITVEEQLPDGSYRRFTGVRFTAPGLPAYQFPAGHVACGECGRVRPHHAQSYQPLCPDCGSGATVPAYPPDPRLTPAP